MSKKFRIRFDKNIDKSFFLYKIRFLRCSRFQKVFYKLVVVNRYNTVIRHLGFYNPFAVNFKMTYRKVSKPFFYSKLVAVDKIRVMLWLMKGAVPTPVVSLFFEQMGVFKKSSVVKTQKVVNLYLERRTKFFSGEFFYQQFANFKKQKIV